VILGALGAHALSSKVDSGMLSAKSMHAFETAVHYQIIHTLAIVAMVAVRDKYPMYNRLIISLFMLGILLFSGSIYGLVTGDLTGTDLKFFGPITPLGGLCFIAGWFMLIVSAMKYKKSE
jgi:uncharacterized membrane protein YgdD (TMEM256/DUF423 family)